MFRFSVVFASVVVLLPALADRSPVKPVTPVVYVTPPSETRVEAWLFPSVRPCVFGLLLRPQLSQGFTLAVDPRAVHVDITGFHTHHTAAASVVAGLPRIPDPPSDMNEPQVRWLTVAFKRDSLPPDIYIVSVKVPTTALSADGTKFELPIVTATIDVNLPPQTDAEPSLSTGQKFLDYPDIYDVYDLRIRRADLRDSHGRPAAQARLLFQVLTLKRVLAGSLIFSSPVGEVSLRTAVRDPNMLPGLKPIITDAHVRDLQRRFVGHRVWGFGGGALETLDKFRSARIGVERFGTNVSLVVRRIVRIRLAGILEGIGGTGEDNTGADFTVVDPIIAVFDSPRGGWPVTISESGADTKFNPDEPPSSDGRAAFAPYRIVAYTRFADTWDWERRYSALPPWRLHPKWPKRVIADIKNGQVRKGQTPDQVAWVRGWPAMYGSPFELRRREVWPYFYVMGISYTLYFKNGRVADIDSVGPPP